MKRLCGVVLTLLLGAPFAWAGDLDSDHDGLSDFREIHKHGTDPKQADSDGDGKPDGEWDERREYAYSIRTVVRVMPPYNKAQLTDDHQDARVRQETEAFIELEVIHYPLNTVAEGMVGERNWRLAAAVARPDELEAGVTTNWDAAMRERVLAELKAKGIDPRETSDRAFVEAAAPLFLARARAHSFFCTYYVGFDEGKPHVLSGCEQNFLDSRGDASWSVEDQFEHELFGRTMYEHRTRGTCTSSAVYLTTVLRAAGVPTRMIVVIPLVDASDPEQVSMVDGGLTHHGVRRTICTGLNPGSTAFSAHTFNEVWVGGRWHRLNYEKLGESILNPRYLGLMTHVHTFLDLSEARLGETWGMRYATGERSPEFPHGNPYRTLEVSDLFGAHCRVENPEPEGGSGSCAPRTHRHLTISRAYWNGSDAMPPGLRGASFPRMPGGVFFVHGKEWFSDANYVQYRPFRDQSDPNLVLKAEGRPDVAARATGYFFTSGDGSEREFHFVIPEAELAKVVPGVPYAIHPRNESAHQWKVDEHVRLVRPQ